MLRNFDLPEAIIFYGMDSFLQSSGTTSTNDKSHSYHLQPGVMRLMKESKETDTCVILLSETKSQLQMEEAVCSLLSTNINDGEIKSNAYNLVIRSSLDMKDPSRFQGQGIGYAPCPAALLDAISSVEVQPKGFGGSSGFGTKQADPTRSPLPKHVVVFIRGPSSTSRARASATRLAGMRSIYIEKDGMGSCDADDLVDGVVETLGCEEEGDWDLVTLDDISTPGSFWLNPPSPRDDDGDRVEPDEIISWFVEQRSTMSSTVDNDNNNDGENSMTNDVINEVSTDEENELKEEDLASILADLDPL